MSGNRAYGNETFRRSKPHFTDRVTADGRDGRPVAAGRYRLVVSRACPSASRSLVARRLLGLEDALALAVADPIQDDRSCRFTLDPDGRRFLSEAYDRRESGHPGGVSVPAIVDVPSGELVTHDYQQITLDLATEWTALHRDGAPDLYPSVLTPRLARQRCLVGDTITQADIRLFTTLVRFDAVCHGQFKCNRWKLTENQVLWVTPAASSRRPASVTRSTSTTSSGTTTRCTPASIRPASCRWAAGPPPAGERVTAQGQP